MTINNITTKKTRIRKITQKEFLREGERNTFKRMITEVYPNGIVSLVSDTYNLWEILTDIAPSLKKEIEQRNGKVVFRPDCYDEKTEILTNNGWKFFNQLNENDLVAQVLDNGSREFVKPIKITNMEYEGDMHHFQDFHGKVDLLVTPNHRMILQQNGKERIVEASKLTKYGNNNQKMIRSASAPSNLKNRLSNLERLKIAFQADGSFCSSGNNIRFLFSKQRKIDRLKEILDYLDYEYKIYDLQDGRKEFNIQHKEIFEKDFSWVQEDQLTKEWCEDFIEECSYWDSCRRSNDRFKFDTTVLSVANKVEFIALSAGYGVLKSFYEDNRSENFSDLITLHILKDNTINGQSWQNKIEHYSGKIYCVTVPTGRLFVRRNRCTMVCGNSGDPIKIVCGYFVKKVDFTYEELREKMSSNSFHMQITNCEEDAFLTTDGIYVDTNCKILSENEIKGAIQILDEQFGSIVNSKGYKELNPKVGLIYGDSITYLRCEKICEQLKRKGYASNNIVFGVGSYTYQYNTRDTFSIACKATYVEVDGKSYNIFKNPITDDGTKKSACGLLKVERKNFSHTNKLILKDQVSKEEELEGELKTVFLNGKCTEINFETIRKNVEHAMSDL